MQALNTVDVVFERRRHQQDGTLAVKDVYEALEELVTNPDDRYQLMEAAGVSIGHGRIEIEIDRRYGRRVIRVRDFADGMTSEDMALKLGRSGNRVSGQERGEVVRGTNSRGAKDVSCLGRITYDSIAAEDGRHHRCEIVDYKFTPYVSEEATAILRDALGLPEGSGTCVSLEVGSGVEMPRHKNMVAKLSRWVPLRDILTNPSRVVVVRELKGGRETILTAPVPAGRKVISETLSIPGYPDAKAKLVIRRAEKPFGLETGRSRMSGILVKSTHAVHESTYFDPKLEHDAHALVFFGKVTCPHIDRLANEWDDRSEQGLPHPANNRLPIVDPTRNHGLTKKHPFVEALSQQVLLRLRRLVAEEESRTEGQKADIESEATKKRNVRTGTVVTKFLEDHEHDDDDPLRNPEGETGGSLDSEKGYVLSPPFMQMVVGDNRKVSLRIRTEAFPEIKAGDNVHIACHTDEVSTATSVRPLQVDPNDESLLQASWHVHADKQSSATGIRVNVGTTIVTECTVEVFATRAEKYAHIETLQFSNQRYRVRTDRKGGKKVTLIAPASLISSPAKFELECDSSDFDLKGTRVMQYEKDLGISRATFTVRATKPDVTATLTARIGELEAKAELRSYDPEGKGITIKIVDKSFGMDRARIKSNILEVAARHPAIRRYLGPPKTADGKFPGQETAVFRAILAEIVAGAVCHKVMEDKEAMGAYEEQDLDANFFAYEFNSLMSMLLPKVHESQLADGEVNLPGKLVSSVGGK